jgi:hypothetical protein
MKKLALLICAILGVTFSAGALSAGSNPVSPPNSQAFGRSLDAWLGDFWRQYFTFPEVVGEKNITFLPIACSVPTPTCLCEPTSTGVACTFDVTVAPGTPLVIPFVGWVGYSADDFLPPECWGQTCNGPPPVNLREVFADATLDGKPIGEPSAAYYVGPTFFDPPIPCPYEGAPDNMCVLYQSIGVVIKPLNPGTHLLVLYSGLRGEDPPPVGAWSLTYNNMWNITVLPPGKK